MYLPHSQKYEPGYLAWPPPEFTALLRRAPRPAAARQGRRGVLQPGAVPRRRHNRSADVRRMANLLQVSSAFGRAMESVDRAAMCDARSTRCWPGARPPAPVRGSWTTSSRPSAEGYAFPTNLDRDPPVDGLAPPTQADLVRRALAEGWDAATFTARLDAHTGRRARARPDARLTAAPCRGSRAGGQVEESGVRLARSTCRAARRRCGTPGPAGPRRSAGGRAGAGRPARSGCPARPGRRPGRPGRPHRPRSGGRR